MKKHERIYQARAQILSAIEGCKYATNVLIDVGSRSVKIDGLVADAQHKLALLHAELFFLERSEKAKAVKAEAGAS